MNMAMTSAANAQIVTAYEEHALAPEAIAEDFGYSADAVKMVLLQCSTKYKAAVTGIPAGALASAQQAEVENDTFSEEEVANAKRVIASLSRESEMDNVRLKAAIYIIDEKKGRNDAIKGLAKAGGVGGFNITVVNQHFQEAREAMNRARRNARDLKVISMETAVA